MNVVVVRERERERGRWEGARLWAFSSWHHPPSTSCVPLSCKRRLEGVFVTGTEERRVGATTLLRQGIADDGARAAAAAAPSL